MSGAAVASALLPASAARGLAPVAHVGPPPSPGQDAQEATTEITADTIEEAERLVGVTFTDEERQQMVPSLRRSVRGFIDRRTFEPPNELAPASVFDPRLPGRSYDVADRGFARSKTAAPPLPRSEADIAFAPLTQLSQWIESRQISSVALTRLYLDRLKQHGPGLECIVTLTEARAMAAARKADAEIEAGRYRGPLHGIPWGAKDLLDTKGIKTTYGAAPYKDRVAESDAAVVRMLDEAGAVLIAKLTLGALAYGDIWFGGRTNNPWNTEQGSSGSSAGPAAATAAGLVGFAIGTETYGSIVSPSMRCGTTGLRPTFGRVPRTGAMALCWSLDKIGPICRTVEDTMLVLNAINGYDAGDASSIDMPLSFNASQSVRGLRLGYQPQWFEGRRASAADKRVFEVARRLGVQLVEIGDLPELPYGSMLTILNVEAATAFEEITLKNTDDQMVWQSPQAWPNSFRQTRFTPAIEFVQADRLRRRAMEVMADRFEEVDAIFGPSFAGGMLMMTNFTGHPCLVMRSAITDDNEPRGFTIWGRLFDEGTIARLGMAFEGELQAWDTRPPLTA